MIDLDATKFSICIYLLNPYPTVYTKIWKKGRKGLKSSKDHVSKESIACRSEPADSNAALESAFFRQRQQITTKAKIGTGTRYDGLYKRGKNRVQVILN